MYSIHTSINNISITNGGTTATAAAAAETPHEVRIMTLC
jgi:hypothetical protein